MVAGHLARDKPAVLAMLTGQTPFMVSFIGEAMIVNPVSPIRPLYTSLSLQASSRRGVPGRRSHAEPRASPRGEPPEKGRAERTGSPVADEKLSQIDLEVRAHEATHIAALGVLAGGGPSFDYLIGPNGERYAVGGSVRVNLNPVPGDPEATIRRAKVIIQAAYAVGMPSAADVRVAAEAYEMEMEAKRELAKKAEGSAGLEIGGEEKKRPYEVYA
jgi:hypothetical protein